MSYITIDTMASLAMPSDRTQATRRDFITWVDRYLKGHKDQPYQYRGKDVYAARCAFLHTYGSEAKLHSQDDDLRVFGYHDGGKHAYDPKISRLVIIGTASFPNDVIIAVESFLRDCMTDANLRGSVGSRLPKMLVNSFLHREMGNKIATMVHNLWTRLRWWLTYFTRRGKR